MIPKAPTREETVQMAQGNREFAEFLRQVQVNQAKADDEPRIGRACVVSGSIGVPDRIFRPREVLLVKGGRSSFK
jgi:hypothetical protein